MKEYKAIAFALDGKYITEGEFKTIEEAWNRINDWGSRWIFFPIPAVIKGNTIVDSCDILPEWKNKRIKTISKMLEKDGDLYANLLA